MDHLTCNQLPSMRVYLSRVRCESRMHILRLKTRPVIRRTSGLGFGLRYGIIWDLLLLCEIKPWSLNVGWYPADIRPGFGLFLPHYILILTFPARLLHIITSPGLWDTCFYQFIFRIFFPLEAVLLLICFLLTNFCHLINYWFYSKLVGHKQL